MLKEYSEMQEKIKKIKDLMKFSLFVEQCYRTAWNGEKIQKVKIQKLQGKKTEEYCFIKMCSVW